MRIFLKLLIAFAAIFMVPLAFGADVSLDAIKVTTNPDGSQDYSVTMQILIIMTLLSFLPSIIIMMTSFTRIVVVLAILRQALGLQTTPSNQIIIGMALFLSFFIMSPVLGEIHDTALEPYMNDQITAKEAFDKAQVPIHKFMLAQTRPSDIALFAEFANEKIENEHQVSLKVLIPAFMVSELKTAFQMGFMLFLPFLVIDLVVSSILMAMGMMMLSPMIVSLPFKIMLFVLVDGWALIMSSLVSSFGVGT
jgi:flagellar biosynthetic protein FliP